MVESEAKELSEATMLEAVMTGHRGFQPVIDAIIRLAERAAKDPRDLVADQGGSRRRSFPTSRKPSCARLTRSPSSRTATPPSTR
ncbi:hypothetical protein [Methylocystis parvus]|uniref:hypothetical protein n=1 Tax=Methylocystis parvus TaxID=134 RepID=UPI003C77D463